jgi:hypothetical protein
VQHVLLVGLHVSPSEHAEQMITPPHPSETAPQVEFTSSGQVIGVQHDAVLGSQTAPFVHSPQVATPPQPSA